MTIQMHDLAFSYVIQNRELIVNYPDKSRVIYTIDHLVKFFDASGKLFQVREATVMEGILYTVGMQMTKSLEAAGAKPVPDYPFHPATAVPATPEDFSLPGQDPLDEFTKDGKGYVQ